MAFTIQYLKEMYEKSYKEADQAYQMQKYAIAKKKFLDCVVFLRRLSTMDKGNEAVYTSRANRLEKLANSIVINQSKPVQSNISGLTPALDDLLGESSNSNNRSYTQNTYQGNQTFGSVSDSKNEDINQFITFVDVNQLKESFDTVIGLKDAKETAKEYIIYPILNKDAYNYNFLNNKCVLLEGPPGTGKTTFAKALAKEVNQPFALVNVASLVNCYVGETGKTIDKVFDYLRDYAKTHNTGMIVFFDEFDEIAKSADNDDKASQSSVPALKRNLDGISENEGLFILANTNCKEQLDKAILNRFRRKIFIPLPNEEERKIFLNLKLNDVEKEFIDQLDLDSLAKEMDGESGRDITQLCDDFKYFLGGIKSGNNSCIDLNQAFLERIRKHKAEK